MYPLGILPFAPSESMVSTDDNAQSSWSLLYTEAHHGASPAPIPIELAPGAKLVPIEDVAGPAFYTPQSPPGTSFEQYREWVWDMQVPHHFGMEEGSVEVVGGTGQAEDTELMAAALEDTLGGPHPSKYMSDLVSALFHK